MLFSICNAHKTIFLHSIHYTHTYAIPSFSFKNVFTTKPTTNIAAIRSPNYILCSCSRARCFFATTKCATLTLKNKTKNHTHTFITFFFLVILNICVQMQENSLIENDNNIIATSAHIQNHMFNSCAAKLLLNVYWT